jgi:DNA-binding transcriptional ArsR family regulator
MVNSSQALDASFKALADPTRRAVLRRLARGPGGVTELAKDHGMTLAGMLKHIRVLEAAGMVRTAKHGRRRICEMKPQSCDRVAQWLATIRSRWEKRFDSMERYLEELDRAEGR